MSATESDDTPVLKVMRLLGEASVPSRSVSTLYGQGLGTTLGTLMCARHLAMSRSSLSAMLLMNDKLETVYTPVPISHAMTSSCKTVVKVPSFLDRGSVASMGAWASIAAQKLDQITRSWNASFKFKQQKEPRVSCLQHAAPPPSLSEL